MRFIPLTVDCNVAQSGRAIVLHIGILRVQETNKNRDSSCINELLPVLI